MYLKYIYHLIIGLIKSNIVKIFMIVLSLVLLVTAIRSDINKTYEYDVLSKIKINGTECYTYIQHGEYFVKNLNDVNIKNDKIYIVEVNTPVLVLYCSSILLIIMVIMVSFNPGWNLDDCSRNSFKKMISHDFENNKHIYRVGNRLIGNDPSRLIALPYQPNYPKSYSELKKYPIYYTKEEIRNKKLKNLGI